MIKKSFSWPGLSIFFLFLIFVNLASGFVATSLNYPSLFNVNASFGEYAVPLPFTWALAHWPSMLIYGIPLLYLTFSRQKFVLYYRVFCAATFSLLLFTLGEKNPFLLFPTVDACAGLIFSLVLVPPKRSSNPLLFPLTLFASLAATCLIIFMGYNYWQHRTPTLSATVYVNGVFELTSIETYKDLHEMRIIMDLKARTEIAESCELAQQVAGNVLRDYPFDTSYNKLIELWFNPSDSNLPENNGKPYPLGEISLNETDKGQDGLFPCYLSYK